MEMILWMAVRRKMGLKALTWVTYRSIWVPQPDTALLELVVCAAARPAMAKVRKFVACILISRFLFVLDVNEAMRC